MKSIRSAVEGVARYLDEHPEAAAETDSPAVAVLEDGLRFRVDGPNGSVATDMAVAVGGSASAPSPGWLMRAALASCDASLIAIEAAREGIELTSLDVTVESESDHRGMLGVGGPAPPGPVAMRTRVDIAASNADEDRLRALVERAERHSPVKDALARAMPMTTEVVVA